MFRLSIKASALAACLGAFLAAGMVNAQSSPTYYVRAGATGANNGSDWANAYAALPPSLTRGAIYYVADGNYPKYDFNDPESGTSRISILKATIADHGTSTGWQNSYGDERAVFGGGTMTTGYWTIDGNTDAIGLYGFFFNTTPPQNGDGFMVGKNIDPLLKDLVFQDLSFTSNGALEARAVNINGVDNMLMRNVESYCADEDTLRLSTIFNSMLEYLHLHTRCMPAGSTAHGDAIQVTGRSDNVTVRHSKFNWQGQQLFWTAEATYAHGTWHVYGNLFYGGPLPGGKGIHVGSAETEPHRVYVYNNTFANLYTAMTLKSGITTGDVRNNIFYAIGSAVGFGSTVHDFNWFQQGLSTAGEAHAKTGTNPFVNAQSQDYRLGAATGPGATLLTPYLTDPRGLSRGADGFWDMGALEYVSSSTTAKAPAAPTNVSIRRE
jgi:hypothetical protein